MKFIFVLATLALTGCTILDANFEADRIGARPSIFPVGDPDDLVDPDDRIELSFPSFTGSVVGSPFRFAFGLTDSNKALEVTRNSSVSFFSEPISEARSRSRHRVTFYYQDGTVRGLNISLSSNGRTLASVRLIDESVILFAPNRRREVFRTIPVGTVNPTLKFDLRVDPVTGETRALISTRDRTYATTFPFAAPGEATLSTLVVSFRVDNGGQFPRGLFVVDDVYARWDPRISFGTRP